ncbi:MAG: DUF5961 family protein [Caulobacteraceae bacterium]
MTDTTSSPHRFVAHARGQPRHGEHVVPNAGSFEDAALRFTEYWSPEPDNKGEVSVIVTDRVTGEQQCFVVDLDGGDAAPCD